MSKENKTSQGLDQQEQMLRGAAWLTASNFISRLLGVAYLIPWYIWMGKVAPEANALFNMGYNIYGLFLLMSTVGINVAVAKQVSKYNASGNTDMTYQLLRGVLGFMLVCGLVFAGVMYLGAPLFAAMSGGGDELIPVLQSLTPAVLVFPAMSVMRGFFQGFNNLKPYALSQIAEQVIRVIWMLVTTYFIMQLGSENYVTAVVQSTFAAFIGMGASVVVLLFYLFKAGMLGDIFKPNSTNKAINTKAILIDTMKEAIPFIITGSAIQIFQIIDQMTFINVMNWRGGYDNSELMVLFSYFSSNPNKILMLLIAVATSIGGVGIPLLTENYIKKDHKSSARLVLNSLTMLLVFLLPAVMGSILLAKPLYAIFYGIPNSEALTLFIAAMGTTILLGLYTVLAPMIQALFQNRRAVQYFLYGTIVKLLLQLPAIYLLGAYGPLLTTSIGLAVPIVLMYQHIQSITHFSLINMNKRSLLIGVLTIIMAIVVIILEFILSKFYPVTDRTSSIIHLVIVGGVGATIYAYSSLVTRLADYIIGKNKANSLRSKLNL